MRSFIKTIMVIGLLCLLAGCIQVKEEYTLNPDGTGKVIYETTAPLGNPFGGKKDEKPEDQARGQVDKILTESSGVSVWKDVTYKINDDGKLHFKGTAYFKKFLRLQLGEKMQSSFKAEFVKKAGGMELRLVDKKENKRT